ncbi:hypothetical protein JCM5296_006262 [Sporobolomyces johnsonii]
MSHSAPPLTPASAVSPSSSFLFFSPEAPQSPASPSPSIYSVDSAPTPRAYRRPAPPLEYKGAAASPLPKLQAPPRSRSTPTVEQDVFSDAMGLLSPASSSPASSSNASTPTQVSFDDDIVVYDGSFVHPDSLTIHDIVRDAQMRLEALGLASDGDASSAWEEELYSSLSDSAPPSPTIDRPRIPTAPWSPSKTPRTCSSSPRRVRKTPTTPCHPFRSSHSSPRLSPRHSPRHSPRYSPRRSPARSCSRPSSALHSPSLSPARGRSSTLVSSSSSVYSVHGFRFVPTSPISGRTGLSPSPRIRNTPSKSTPRSRSKTPGSKSKARLHLESKLEERSARRTAQLLREAAEDGRPRAKTAEGFDLEALDEFFGITAAHGKAMRGGYGAIATREKMVGRKGEEESWRKVDEFRALLRTGETDTEEEEEHELDSNGSEGDGARGARGHPRRRPPPLDLTRSRSSSFASLGSIDTDAGPLSAATIATPSTASYIPSPDPLSKEIRRRKSEAALRSTTTGLELSKGKGLKHKRSVGDRLRELCGLAVGKEGAL